MVRALTKPVLTLTLTYGIPQVHTTNVKTGFAEGEVDQHSRHRAARGYRISKACRQPVRANAQTFFRVKNVFTKVLTKVITYLI